MIYSIIFWWKLILIVKDFRCIQIRLICTREFNYVDWNVMLVNKIMILIIAKGFITLLIHLMWLAKLIKDHNIEILTSGYYIIKIEEKKRKKKRIKNIKDQIKYWRNSKTRLRIIKFKFWFIWRWKKCSITSKIVDYSIYSPASWGRRWENCQIS